MDRSDKHARWARRRLLRDKDHPLNAPQPVKERIYGREVGIVMAVLEHSTGRFSSDAAWDRAVPKWARAPGKVVKR